MTVQFVIAVLLVRMVSVTVIVPHCPTYLLGRFFQEISVFFGCILYLIPTVSIIFSRYEHCYLKMTYKYYIHNHSINLQHAGSPSMLPPVLSVWGYL